MIDRKPDGSDARMAGEKPQWIQYGILITVCALIIGGYACIAHSGVYVSGSLNAADNSYNLLVQGFRASQLSLKKEVPPGFTQLADPYDPTENVLYRSPPYWMHDLSYYKGRLFIYFGVTPALLLFWPYVALTGHYLSYGQAGVIFCTVGFLTSVYLLLGMWRRYVARASVWVVAAGVLALGLTTSVPFLLAWCDIYEVTISCAYALAMLALAAIWNALHSPSQRGRWLLTASVAFGLAVGARPTLLPGAAMLLVPVGQGWREQRKVWGSLLAAAGPMVFIGLGLMLYNLFRFDNPLEFGLHYQLAGTRQLALQLFSLRNLWSNLRAYFLEPVSLTNRLPFVHLRSGLPFGVLNNVPVVWLALAVPLAWRNRSAQGAGRLSAFLVAATILFGASAVSVATWGYAQCRYEVDFFPALMLLAMTGMLGLESAMALTAESGLAGRRVLRRCVRWGCGVLLVFSVMVNLLLSAGRCAEAHHRIAGAFMRLDNTAEAIKHYAAALRLAPGYAEAHNDFGVALMSQGKLQEAIGHYQQALRIKPDYAETHNNLGIVLEQTGKTREAIDHYEQALRILPGYAKAHYNWGIALQGQGKLPEAISHYEQALRLQPDFADAHYNLGVTLFQLGRLPEAIDQYEQALQLNSDDADAHYYLGLALEKLGRMPEAIQHYEQALRIKPDLAAAQNNLGGILQRQGKLPEAIAHYEQALRLKPDLAFAHYNLGLALVHLGRLPEAVGQYEQTLQLNSDDAEAHYQLGLALEKLGRIQEAIQHYEQALRIKPDFVKAQNALARVRAAH